MATGHLHLFRRDAIYYWRRRLPKALGAALGRSHLCRSMGTADPTLARRRARRVSSYIDDLDDRLRAMKLRQPNRADLDRVLWQIFQSVLDDGEADRAMRPPGFSPWAVDDTDSPEAQYAAENQSPHDKAEHLRAALEMQDFSPAQPTVEKALQAQGLTRPGDADFQVFLRKALITLAEAHHIDAEREEGRYPQPHHPFFTAAPISGATMPTADDPQARIKISEIARECMDAKIASREHSKAMTEQVETALALFIELVGDLPYLQIQREDAVAFRAKLLDLPRHHGRGFYAKVACAEAIRTRKAIQRLLESKPDAETFVLTVAGRRREVSRQAAMEAAAPLAPRTVNKHFIALGSLYEWREDMLRRGLRNPFAKLTFKRAHLEETGEDRDPWPSKDLTTLFQSPVWSGCESLDNRATKGEQVIEDHCFWVPLLALFTGMRLNEICQLETADVFVEEETNSWMVQVVKEGEKRVKNKQSQRIIPLHPEIIKVGFPDYVAAARAAGHRRLFPALVPQGSRKTLAAGLSKWFGRYRDSKAVALSGRWMDLHALRHNFATALDQTLEKDSALHRLMGHKGKRTTFDIYTKGLQPKALLKVIQAVEVGVSVTHLYRAAQPQRRYSFEVSKRQRARRLSKRDTPDTATDR